MRLHGLGFFRLRGDVARAGKRRLHRFAGAGCSAPKLAELIRSSNSVQWTASSVPRLQLQRLACQSEVSQSAALRLEALWSDETGDGESGDALACQCGFRPLGIVGAGLWKRASQLAERPLARAHPVEIPSGVLARSPVGGIESVRRPSASYHGMSFWAQRRRQPRSFADRVQGSARTAAVLRSRGAVRGQRLSNRFAGEGALGHIWSGFVVSTHDGSNS